MIVLALSACSSPSSSVTHTTTPTQRPIAAELRLIATASSGSPPQVEADVDVVNLNRSIAITIRTVHLEPLPGIGVTGLKMDNGSAPFSNDLPRRLKLSHATILAPGAVQTLRIGLEVTRSCQRLQDAAPAVEIEYDRSGAAGSVRLVPEAPAGRSWLAALICPHRE